MEMEGEEKGGKAKFSFPKCEREGKGLGMQNRVRKVDEEDVDVSPQSTGACVILFIIIMITIIL